MDTLVLSSTFEPLITVTWYEAFCQVLKGSARIIEEYPDRSIKTVRKDYPMPSIIQHVKFVKPRRVIRFSRENVWLRDGGRCQYCSKQCGRGSFTFDHVNPRSQGGQTTWSNVVVACHPCNQKKAGRTPKQANMKLNSEPVVPKSLSGFRRVIKMPRNAPDSWGFYLRSGNSDVYWDIELLK